MDTILETFQQAAGRHVLDRSVELELVLACIVARGHLLIEDTPGVGKTTLVKVTARLLGLDFKRVQFTNDLLPADILGGRVFNAKTGSFTFHKGPIFAQLVLADELNRASPRTQSAVLQAMEEHEVTVEGETYPLPSPFVFIGTQNPRDQAGTAALPESQLDRFLMRISLGNPARETCRKLLIKDTGRFFVADSIEPIACAKDVLEWQGAADAVYVSDAVMEYILDLADNAARRGWDLSPRAALGLRRAAKALAFLRGRSHVLPDDIREVFPAVVAHRLLPFAEASESRAVDRMASELLAQTPCT